jgi:hypothetical protein
MIPGQEREQTVYRSSVMNPQRAISAASAAAGPKQARAAQAFLSRLRPWLGKAVHVRWGRRRSLYQSEIDALLVELQGQQGRMPSGLRLRIEGFLGRLYREWFPPAWRRDPTYAQVVADFRWWLGMAERWNEAPPRPARRRSREALADQPDDLCRMVGLKPGCTAREFADRWRVFLKRNHPDLNPDQTPEERRRFAAAMGMRRR